MPNSVALLLPAALWSLPWWIVPAILYARLRDSASLDDVDPTPSTLHATPKVSVILPARNEAVHIAACVRSILSTTWPNLELIVIDDHSTDGTAELARAAAAGDVRLTLVSAPDLPPGWFGKQWACQAGSAQASGELLLFTDADTRHAPELIARMVKTRSVRSAELLSVAGRQEMGTVWERAVQPCVFALILLRYGGTATLERARSASDVVANGQCFMLSRETYDQIGGHHAVRDYVAEDLMMAQAVWSSGKRVSLVLGVAQLSTRMYNGLAELVKGWGKNVYAGGRFAMRGGAVGRAIYPAVLLSFPLGIVAPFIALLFGLIVRIAMNETSPWLVWGALSSVSVIGTFALTNRLNRDARYRALLAPMGGTLLLAICLMAIARGRNVSWKGRGYLTR